MSTNAFEIAQAVLLSVGGGGLIVLALSSWLGKVWANRILEADRLKYSEQIEHIKQSNKTVADALSVAASTHSEFVKAYAELRGKAITKLWEDFLKIKTLTPISIFYLDIIPKGKKPSQVITQHGRKGVEEDFSNKRSSLMNLDSETFAPYLDERHMELLHLYRKAIFRIHSYYSEIESNDLPNKGAWRNDELFTEHFKLIFGEDELNKVQMNKWTTSYLMTFLEKSLIAELRNALTGFASSKEVLQQALANIDDVTKLRRLEAVGLQES